MTLCPRCRVPMVEVEEAQVACASCPQCQGTWISGTALERRTRQEITPEAPHMAVAPLADLADTVSHSNCAAPLACPLCKQVMAKGRFHPQIPVQIDRCERCVYLWLDAGEMGLLVRLYRELVENQRVENPEQRDRLDRLHEIHTAPANNGLDGVTAAVEVGMTVLGVVCDLFLTPRHSYHHHYDWTDW